VIFTPGLKKTRRLQGRSIKGVITPFFFPAPILNIPHHGWLKPDFSGLPGLTALEDNDLCQYYCY
jgi:hypothetical protein